LNLTTKQRKNIKRATWLLFIIYIFVMAYFLFFSEMLHRGPGETYRYNLEFFKEIKRGLKFIGTNREWYFWLNIAMNVVAFMPLGFCLPIVSEKHKNFIRVFIISVLLSLGIETLQLYFKVGSFDVDDILMNVSGALLGFILERICFGIYKLFHRKRKRRRK